MNSEIHFMDWQRILFGETPYEFTIEVVIRILFLYIFLVIAMRIMGPRLAAIITRNELIALVTLSAAVGVAILMPERGLLPPVIVIIVVICIQYLIARITRKSKTADKIILDEIACLVKDGQFQLDVMKKSRITKARVISELRSNAFKNLGSVQRAYMEANGSFSILTFSDGNENRPGLCLIPPFDKKFRNELEFNANMLACTECGNTEDKKVTVCANCGGKNWENTITGE
jgi:uncharacterized membrane protein YcaP (DUF421 family)